jgi:alpha-glucosidase
MLLLTLRGTPTIYYGDEIGMEQVTIPPDRIRDPVGKNVPGRGQGRDGCRTPMQWDAGPHAGFSTAEPWLPLSATFTTHNVAAQRRQPTSIYHLHRRLIALRRTRKALLYGRYGAVQADGDLLLFTRELAGERILVALNLGGEPTTARPGVGECEGQLHISSVGDREGEAVRGPIKLRAHEGVVVELAGTLTTPPAISP